MDSERYKTLRVLGIQAPNALKHPSRIFYLLTHGWLFDTRHEVLYTQSGQIMVRAQLRFVDGIEKDRWTRIQGLLTEALKAAHSPSRDRRVLRPFELAEELQER